ncbi:unnamed protein product [Brassica rapa subsp. trilocularis]
MEPWVIIIIAIASCVGVLIFIVALAGGRDGRGAGGGEDHGGGG